MIWAGEVPEDRQKEVAVRQRLHCLLLTRTTTVCQHSWTSPSLFFRNTTIKEITFHQHRVLISEHFIHPLTPTVSSSCCCLFIGRKGKSFIDIDFSGDSIRQVLPAIHTRGWFSECVSIWQCVCVCFEFVVYAIGYMCDWFNSVYVCVCVLSCSCVCVFELQVCVFLWVKV